MRSFVAAALPHVATAALARTAGVEMTHVPYRGSAGAATALLRTKSLLRTK